MTFRSRVFKTREDKDAWVKRMTEAGRSNYEHFVQKRPMAYLKMRKDAQLSTSSPNAGTVGSAPTFDVGKKRRKINRQELARFGKVTKHAGQIDDELHDPRLWSNLRGAFTSAEERVKAHKKLRRGRRATIGEAVRHGWSRGKTASFDAGVKHAFVAATLGAGLGVLAIYDALSARGHKGDVEKVRLAITTGKLVDSRAFVKKIDPKIKVLTTGPDIDRALMSEPNLPADKRKMIVVEVDEDLRAGRNAYALVGERAAYIFAPARTSASVLGHEIGHVLDFRKRGLNYRNQGKYEGSLAAAVWKPSHESSTMSAEREAWRRSPIPDKALERAALGSYEKSFHGRRAFMAGSASALALTVAMLKAAEMTPGEYERETSAPGVTGRGHESHRLRTERRPGNQKSGVPMWIRYSKGLQSASTRGFGDDRSGYEQRL